MVTTFSVLNLLIGVIVNSLQTMQEDTKNSLDTHLTSQDAERAEIKAKLSSLELTIKEIKAKL